MKFKVTMVCMGVCFLFFVNGAQAFKDGDYQYWNTESVTWKLNDQYKLKVEQETYLGDDMSNYYYTHLDVGVIYSGLAKWIDVGLNYRGINEKVSSGWEYEHRPHVNILLKTTVADFALSNNSRFEFRMRKSAEDKMRYRNKTTVRLPWEISQWKVRPYLADEVFFDTESVEMNRNRIYCGVSAKVTKSLTAEIYYMLQNDKTSTNDWNDTRVLGSQLKWSF